MVQQEQLQRLGWAPPGDGWGAGHVLNWSHHWAAPVDLDEVVDLALRTLRSVYEAEPSTVIIT